MWRIESVALSAAIRRVESGVYGGLNVAYSPVWNWRFLADEAFGAIRQVESGVYGGLELAFFWRTRRLGRYGGLMLAFFDGRGVWGDTPGWSWRFLADEAFGAIRRVEVGVFAGLELAFFGG